MNDQLLRRAAQAIRKNAGPVVHGRVQRVAGFSVEAHVPGARIGDQVEIEREGGVVIGEVVGFRDHLALVVPFSEVRGIAPGARAFRREGGADMPVSDALFGRVVDAFGRPLDGGPTFLPTARVAIDRAAPTVESRARVERRFDTGVRVIDGLLSCGQGQRVGIFAGAGVGKTILIRQIMKQSSADVVVVGLIGERGCEVQDLMSSGIGPRSIVIAATSDRSPLERARGAKAATAVAEYYRDRGASVLLILDSLTRYAMALREIGLAASEPPATKGYPPSVFATLPRLLERVAPFAQGGAITAFYTVLVEGDDLNDPVADSARSLLDGHIVLSRDLASRGHFPAVDVLASASRVSRQVTSPEVQAMARRIRQLLATRREVEELRSLGAYTPGSYAAYDEAIELGGRLDEWSRQEPTDRSSYEQTLASQAAAIKTKAPLA